MRHRTRTHRTRTHDTRTYSFFDGAEEGEAVEEATRDMSQLLDTLITEANAAASSTSFSLQAGEDEDDTNQRYPLKQLIITFYLYINYIWFIVFYFI